MTHSPPSRLKQVQWAAQKWRRRFWSWLGLRYAALRPELPSAVRALAWTVSVLGLLTLGILTGAVGLRLVWTPLWQLTGAESATETAQRVNDYRLALGPIFVGMLQGLAGAAILYGFWLNIREHEFSRLQHRQQRLKDAVLQLESQRQATRLAALLELESIAMEDSQQRERIIDVIVLHLQTAVRPPIDFAQNSADSLRTLEGDVVSAFGILSRLGRGRGKPVTLRLDLTRIDFDGLSFFGLRFDGSDFSESHFTGGFFPTAPAARFKNAKFTTVTLNGTGPGSGRSHEWRDLDRANFAGAEFHTCIIMMASLRYSVFDGALFTAKTLLNGDLTGASLRKARFVDAYFEGRPMDQADLDGTTFDRCPIGYAVRFEKCKVQPANYPDGYVK